MAGFMDILGTVLQQGMSKSSNGRLTRGLGGGSSSGGLGDLLGGLGQMMGGAKTGGSASQSAGGLGGVLGEVMGSLGGSNKATIGGLGALAGAILGGGAKSTRGAIGGGGLAMLASLAFSALSKAGKRPAQTPRALSEPQTPQDFQALENDAEIIIKAMINAAKADGNIDSAEVQNIIGKLSEDGLSEQDKQFFMAEAKKPIDFDGIAAATQGDAELAAQVYAASLLAVNVDTPQEKNYLHQLANRLGLPPQVVSHIEETLGVHA